MYLNDEITTEQFEKTYLKSVDVGKAIEAQHNDEDQQLSKETTHTLVEKCLSKDTEVAGKAWQQYKENEQHNSLVLKNMARDDLKQIEREFNTKLSQQLKKEDVTKEVAEAKVWADNPSLYNQYSLATRILEGA